MAFDEKAFLELCSKCFENANIDILSECDMKVRVAHILMNTLSEDEVEIFCEYPYSNDNSRDNKCDIVITNKNDHKNPTHWIGLISIQWVGFLWSFLLVITMSHLLSLELSFE